MDLSPDNIIVAERTQFLDYEWAAFRDVSFDLGSVIAGFPGFLSARPISDEEVDVFVEAWSREVERIWPNVNDEQALNTRIITALVGLALGEVTTLHLGSSHNVVHAVAHAHNDDSVALVEDEVTPVERLLAPAQTPGLTGADRVLRRDLFETFEALARFAARAATTRAADPQLQVVTGFATELAARLDDGFITDGQAQP